MITDSEKTTRPEEPDAEVEKTMRPAEQVEKTIRPVAEAESTMRPGAEKTMRPTQQVDATKRPGQQQEREQIIDQQVTEFELNNKLKYKVVKAISKNTGEAQVFLVECKGKQYALKRYNIGIVPTHDILDIVKKSAGTESLLVNTLEYGVWTNPDKQNEKHDYELMELCTGGSLDQLQIPHDQKGEELLADIAVRCARSLAFLHAKKVIHRDVKPANFFFRKNNQDLEHLVLGDFGIAIQTDAEGSAVTSTQLRTKIYAAPEFYDTIQDYTGRANYHFDTKVDFFALGMMLLTLWEGEEKFREKEYELKHLKKFGELPYPSDISDRTLQLLKALTHPNPKKRAGIEDIIRWKNGEDIYDLKQGKDEIGNFQIIFNAAKKQIAHSPEELVKFMTEDKKLSIQYLYHGDIEKWLAGNNRNELKAEIHDITENRFPKDHEAGFYAACYFLDPAMPYSDVKGNALNSWPEVAQSLKNNFKQYEKVLANPNDSLFLFFSAKGQVDIVNQFVPLFKKEGSNRDALLQLIHTIDQSLPWIIVTDDNKTMECYKPEDVLKVTYNHVYSDESWNDLISEAFLVWLRYTDPALEGKIRSTKGHDKRQTVVLYNLSPKVSYTFQMDENAGDYFFTAEEIGNYMCCRMEEYIADEKNSFASTQLDFMCNIDNTRLYDYFKSKGVYDTKISWIKYCGDLKSKDNVNKAGPYNWSIGVFKAIKGLGYAPYFYFPKSDKRVYTLAELQQIPSKEIKEELKKGYLQSWLTTFYQENPALDLKKKYTFEKETVKYLEHLERLDGDNIDVKNYRIGKRSVEKTLAHLKRKLRMHVWSKVLIGVLTLLAAAAVIFGLLNVHVPIDAKDHAEWIYALSFIIGILVVAVMFFAANMGCLVNIIVGVVVGGIFYAILYFCIPFIGYIGAGLLVLMLIFWFVKSYVKYPVQSSAHKKLFKPTFEEMELEPLHFAFSDDQTFKSSIGDASYKYAYYLSTGTKKFYKQLIFPWLLIIGLGALVYWASSQAEGWKAAAEISQALKGEWQGTFEGRTATFTITNAGAKEVNARISVKYTNQTTEALKGTVDLNVKTGHFDDVNPENGVLDGEYNGSFNDDFTAFFGVYQNYKTKKTVDFEFIKGNN